MSYEVVIGLEVHTHLRTASKLFSPAPVTYGDEPNHSVHPIDLGLPGVLPVLNESVVELAIRLGLALHCKVNPRSVFARKNYFYPDLPKGYQISQYEEPVATEGYLDVPLDEVTERMMARGREDDTPESIARRLELYEEQTAPLLQWFADRDKLVVVDGMGTEDEVFGRISGVLAS